jgi:hypothetical protein
LAKSPTFRGKSGKARAIDRGKKEAVRMARLTRRLPSPALFVAIAACVLAIAGTSYAAGFIGVKDLTKGTKVQTLGTGPLVYSTAQAFVPAGQTVAVAAQCPPNLRVIGGGIKVSTGAQVIEGVIDSYPTRDHWRGTVSNSSAVESHTAITTAICAKSERIRGTVGGF